MRCLITAGPTYEPLDQVRRLTNQSTGTLGTRLANHLATLGHDVLLLRGEMATAQLPVAAVKILPFSSVDNLASHLTSLACSDPIRVFHAAAVSDFTFGKTFFRDPKSGDLIPIHAGKLSTRNGPLLAELVPTPKLINLLRDQFPNAIIGGWKYEVDGSPAGVIDRCREQIQGARIQFSIANGPAYGTGFGRVTSESVRHLPTLEALIEDLSRNLQGID